MMLDTRSISQISMKRIDDVNYNPAPYSVLHVRLNASKVINIHHSIPVIKQPKRTAGGDLKLHLFLIMSKPLYFSWLSCKKYFGLHTHTSTHN